MKKSPKQAPPVSTTNQVGVNQEAVSVNQVGSMNQAGGTNQAGGANQAGGKNGPCSPLAASNDASLSRHCIMEI
jgi:hypothetical protein